LEEGKNAGKEGAAMMIQMSVSHLSLSENGFSIVLRSRNGRRLLPVGIGLPEAQTFLARSPAHDLAKCFLDMFECRVVRIEMSGGLPGNSPSACRIIALLPSGDFAAVETRASDAVALALRARAPVFVEDAVLESAGVEATVKNTPDAESAASAAEIPPAAAVERLAETRHRLDAAVAHEQYEEAARLRDELRSLLRQPREV
jgi:bifunctional DNase/RNase